MPAKKSIKKVEIADESIVNLKSRERAKPDFAFQVRQIESNGNEGKSTAENVPIFNKTVTSEAVFDRPLRASRFDPDEMNQRMESFAEKLERAVVKVSPAEGPTIPNVAVEPKDLIRVKFEKFVQLVASKDFLSVLEKNKNEDIVLSSNLLTELASAVEEKSEKKSPVVFLVGLAIGVIITYLLIK